MSRYKDLSDIDLLRQISKYDSRALEELYERYSPLLYTLIKKISSDENTANAILVEVFVIVWRKVDKFDFNGGNVFTWMVTLARNRAVDTVRRTRSSSEPLENYNDEYENSHILPILDKKIDSMDLETAMNIKPKMEAALERLTDAQKFVIHLAYYEGYYLDEVSVRLKVPVETVRLKILTALNNLKDFLIGK
ncbi:MAG: sigma-70 family RNA polymerase sigma factor [Bacteroidetes bacterium]|nr:sigma-70 family RNA polymerase sigma factor [Bacteroidota bacterium]MBU1679328.1 sigma-70 family RNA polymerase sigma factor [Bacteroidota bacterium]MBU2507148.1 sigma-70 family RNA polymerase sigma factor [Bacteroidota bacterium]